MADMALDQPESSSADHVKPISRREFLYYLWGGSAALILVESGAAALWFAFPHFRFGEESGVFKLDLSEVPSVHAPPEPYMPSLGFQIGFWLRNTDAGLSTFYRVCVYKGCSYRWIPNQNRFICPCCGSKFTPDGDRILGEGPAPRNLDRHPIYVITSNGLRKTPTDGSPVSLADAHTIIVDTRFKILGRSRNAYKT